MSPARSRKGLIGFLIVVVLASVAALAVVATRPVVDARPAPAAPPQAGTVGAALRNVMPPRPIMALTTPATGDWWAYVAKMSPSLHLTGVNIDAAPVHALGYGYAQSATQTKAVASDVPFYGAVYLHAGTEKDADVLTGWFATQPGHESRRGYRTGTAVLLAPEWADRTEFTFAADGAARDASSDEHATWTWDLGQWNTTLRERAATPQTRDIAGSALAALGVTDTTVLTATATSPNKPFTGQAVGHNHAKANLGVLAAAVYASDTIVYSDTQESPGQSSVTRTLSSANLSRMLTDSAFTLHDGHGNGKTFGDGTVTSLLPENGTASIAATFDPRAIADYATGHDTDRNASIPLTVQIDANGKAAIAAAAR